MKGIVFTEFLDWVGSDEALPELEQTGHYAATTSYPSEELVGLVERVAGSRGMKTRDLLRDFGKHLFGRFAALYPVFFFQADSALDFLSNINGYVHDEVQKFYPDAEFPHFECWAPSSGRLEMVYGSRRPLADLAEGLILGCIAHFAEPVALEREDLATDGTAARFRLTRAAARPSRRPARSRRPGARAG